MKIGRHLLTLGLFLILTGLIIYRQEDILTIINTYIAPNKNITLTYNEYYRDKDFLYVQNTTNFNATSYQDLINIFYTSLNAGESSFTFYCPKDYKNCLNDVKDIANNSNILSTVNNYVHPYNGFSNIETEINNLGRVTFTFIKSYRQTEIDEINKKIDEVYPTLVQDNKREIDNIKSVHDYIINITKYDTNKSLNPEDLSYKSDIAYGPLFEGYALCGGYTDLMALFLEKMGIPNFKISSDNHIWNAVYINDKWYHLDLTWDDPVSQDGKDYLEENYFLIDTNELLKQDKTEHNFNIEYYKEFEE